MALDWALALIALALPVGALLGISMERRAWLETAHPDYLVAGPRYCNGGFYYVLPERSFNDIQMKALAWEQSRMTSAMRGAGTGGAA